MKPILFNTEMVRAILDGRKTVTRRLVKPQPDKSAHSPYEGVAGRVSFRIGQHGCTGPYKPPCRPGGILYVRETWAVQESLWNGMDSVIYRSNCCDAYALSVKWRPSIHMPREAARIFLRVTAVRAERLQDIGGPEIITKEGVSSDPYDYQTSEWYETHPELLTEAARAAFAGLWDSTVKPTDSALYGWNANPWVWVIEFERISKEEAQMGATGNETD